MIGRTIDEITLGEGAEITHIVTPETIHAFVDASGDDNPIHSDPTFAGGTPLRPDHRAGDCSPAASSPGSSGRGCPVPGPSTSPRPYASGGRSSWEIG